MTYSHDESLQVGVTCAIDNQVLAVPAKMHKEKTMKSSITRDICGLYPALVQFIEDIQKRVPELKPFETHRTACRQLELSQAEHSPTKVGPWRSAHQYGMACDFATLSEGKWLWNNETHVQALHIMLENHPLLHAPIHWDRLHVEVKNWKLLVNERMK